MTSIVYDVLEALTCPVVLCTDAALYSEVGSPVVRGTLAAAERLGRLGPDAAGDPVILVLEDGPEKHGPAIEAVAGFDVLSVPSAQSGAPSRVHPAARDEAGLSPGQQEPLALSARDLELLLTRARGAADLPSVVRHPECHVRAKVALVMDDCFDFYDEESLAQFEVAGAQLVPVSALEDREVEDIDGLIIGDGRIERHSAGLASNRRFREALRRLVDAGVPTLASGGGFAYLSEGLRTLSGTLHPFVGALKGQAVAAAERLPCGHVEVEMEGASIIGPAGTRLRGFVQRAWLLRGLSIPDRRFYRTVSGPPDIGCGSHSLFCTHFRPYWPSAPTAASAFVDRCVSFAALRDSRLGQAAELGPSSQAAGERGEVAE